MKTKILPTNSFCIGKWNDGSIDVGTCSLKDCCIDWNIQANIENLDTPCITTQTQEGERFFFALSHWHKHVAVHTSEHIGHFEGKTLILDEKIVGDSVNQLNDGDHVLINSTQPTDLSFLQDHPCCLLTADGMLTLEKDSYIGFKDGRIDSLTADELLEQLSRGNSERSPHFQRVQLTPLTKMPAKPTKGTLVYNEISGSLEFFNGTSWRKVKLED